MSRAKGNFGMTGFVCPCSLAISLRAPVWVFLGAGALRRRDDALAEVDGLCVISGVTTRELSSEATSPAEEVEVSGKRGDFRRRTSGAAGAAAGEASGEDELSELISEPIISSKTSFWEAGRLDLRRPESWAGAGGGGGGVGGVAEDDEAAGGAGLETRAFLLGPIFLGAVVRRGIVVTRGGTVARVLQVSANKSTNLL